MKNPSAQNAMDVIGPSGRFQDKLIPSLGGRLAMGIKKNGTRARRLFAATSAASTKENRTS